QLRLADRKLHLARRCEPAEVPRRGERHREIVLPLAAARLRRLDHHLRLVVAAIAAGVEGAVEHLAVVRTDEHVLRVILPAAGTPAHASMVRAHARAVKSTGTWPVW